MDEEADYKKNGGTEHKGEDWINSPEGEQRPCGKSAQHEEFPVSYVQDPGNTILKAETHGNKGVDTPHKQAADHNIQKFDKHYIVLLSLTLLLGLASPPPRTKSVEPPPRARCASYAT